MVSRFLNQPFRGRTALLMTCLSIAGVVTLIKPNNYAIEADITPRPDAPDDLKQGLMLIGAPEPDGSRKFNMSGSF